MLHKSLILLGNLADFLVIFHHVLCLLTGTLTFLDFNLDLSYLLSSLFILFLELFIHVRVASADLPTNDSVKEHLLFNVLSLLILHSDLTSKYRISYTLLNLLTKHYRLLFALAFRSIFSLVPIQLSV